jgi:hypothetical protein
MGDGWAGGRFSHAGHRQWPPCSLSGAIFLPLLRLIPLFGLSSRVLRPLQPRADMEQSLEVVAQAHKPPFHYKQAARGGNEETRKRGNEETKKRRNDRANLASQAILNR